MININKLKLNSKILRVNIKNLHSFKNLRMLWLRTKENGRD